MRWFILHTLISNQDFAVLALGNEDYPNCPGELCSQNSPRWVHMGRQVDERQLALHLRPVGKFLGCRPRLSDDDLSSDTWEGRDGGADPRVLMHQHFRVTQESLIRSGATSWGRGMRGHNEYMSALAASSEVSLLCHHLAVSVPRTRRLQRMIGCPVCIASALEEENCKFVIAPTARESRQSFNLTSPPYAVTHRLRCPPCDRRKRPLLHFLHIESLSLIFLLLTDGIKRISCNA